MQVVLDTNIIVRAAGRPDGVARELIRLLLGSQHTLVTSGFILEEVQRVLRYPRMARMSQLTEEQQHEFLRELTKGARVVDLDESPDLVSSDPDDDFILQTAVTGQADVVCSRDRHLREPDVVTYCRERGIRVLSDIELIQEIRLG